MGWNPFTMFAGGAAKAGVEVASGIADIVERWIPANASEQERAQMRQALEEQFSKSQASARAHDAPMSSGVKLLDGIINGVSRLVRPTVTIMLFGGLFGWWDLPDIEGLDPFYQWLIEIVALFWFGGRTLTKDLPAAIRHIVK